MRHAEPQFLKDYWNWIKSGPPKCCHTCEYYSEAGICDKFNMEPPADFAEAVGECESYLQMVPF